MSVPCCRALPAFLFALATALAIALASTLAIAAPPAPAAASIAIRGYDPVAYFTEHRAVPGNPQFELDWDEQRWRFTSAQHRDLFRADPVKYAPQFANFCAVALSRGEVREANPEYWLISDGRLYLFGKPQGPQLFRGELAENVKRAEGNRPLLPAPAARAQAPVRE